MRSTTTIPHLGTVLGVWAHPDDEAYLSAGLMALARTHGHRVVVATATLGERGTDDPERWPPERLREERSSELRRSLATLDVEEHRWLGFADGRCEAAGDLFGIAAVARLIDEVRPDTIVTFGPDGLTGHPDHRAVSRWATAAWERSGRRARLWYATLGPAFHERWGGLNDEVGLWLDGEPPCTPPEELAAEVRLDGRLLDRKVAALCAHATQTAGLVAAVGPETFREWWSTESFRAA